MKQSSSLVLLAAFSLLISFQPKIINTELQTVFNGENLDGWKKAGENPESIVVEDGMIKCGGERCHLYYTEDFNNFEFEAEVKTLEHSNSGIFIHTKFQNEGWPSHGHEIQINNTYRGSIKYPERRKTGSVDNVRNIYYPFVDDNEWFKNKFKVVENF